MFVIMGVLDSIFLWAITLILILKTSKIKSFNLTFLIHFAFIKIHNLFYKTQIIQKISTKNSPSTFLLLLEYL